MKLAPGLDNHFSAKKEEDSSKMCQRRIFIMSKLLVTSSKSLSTETSIRDLRPKFSKSFRPMTRKDETSAALGRGRGWAGAWAGPGQEPGLTMGQVHGKEGQPGQTATCSALDNLATVLQKHDVAVYYSKKQYISCIWLY